MRRISSLVVIAGMLVMGCKNKTPSADGGMGAGAPLDTVTNPSAPVTQLPPTDSAPGDMADSAAIPSTLTPARKDTTVDSAKTRKTTTSSKPPVPKPAEVASASPASGATSPGAASETAGGGELRDAYHKAPLDTVDGKTYQGWKVYNLNCARCHGEDVSGTTIAPHLIMSLKPDGPINSKEIFIQTVCEGRVPKGMPAWCQAGMTPAEIDTVYSYVKARSDAKMHPGRPARKDG